MSKRMFGTRRRLLEEQPRCRRPDGSYKSSFRSAAKARKAIREHHGTGGKKLYVYECPRCGLWHLTHQPQRY